MLHRYLLTGIISILLFTLDSNAQTSHTVVMTDSFQFVPPTLTISVGDTVVWDNQSSMSHTSTSGIGCTADGIWSSGTLAPGATFSRVFSAGGIFTFFCIPHCPNMAGSITVGSSFTVDAGASRGVCSGDTTRLGGNPTANGGTPPYTYLWMPAAGLSSSTSPNPIVTITGADTTYGYVLTVTDGASNTASDTVYIEANPLPPVGTSGNDTICLGGSTVISADSAVTYEWSPLTGLNDHTAPSPEASPSVTTTYIVTGTDSLGCMNTASLTITVDPVLCVGVNDVFNEQSIKLYPNPTTGFIFIEGPGYSAADIELFDLRGRSLRLWRKADMAKAPAIDMRGFESGFYLLKVKMEDGLVVKKILVE